MIMESNVTETLTQSCPSWNMPLLAVERTYSDRDVCKDGAHRIVEGAVMGVPTHGGLVGHCDCRTLFRSELPGGQEDAAASVLPSASATTVVQGHPTSAVRLVERGRMLVVEHPHDLNGTACRTVPETTQSRELRGVLIGRSIPLHVKIPLALGAVKTLGCQHGKTQHNRRSGGSRWEPTNRPFHSNRRSTTASRGKFPRPSATRSTMVHLRLNDEGNVKR